jgi:predicted nucleotidyltransferase
MPPVNFEVIKMLITAANPVILKKFRAALDKLYGSRIERVVLYGSRARGDAQPDSDYDVAVFLKDLADRWAEADRIAIAATEILSETGAVIHAMPYRAGSYQERTPLMHELRREGVDL